MHLHFEKNSNTKCDCTILSLSWMGKVRKVSTSHTLKCLKAEKCVRENFLDILWILRSAVHKFRVSLKKGKCDGKNFLNFGNQPKMFLIFNLIVRNIVKTILKSACNVANSDNGHQNR